MINIQLIAQELTREIMSLAAQDRSDIRSGTDIKATEHPTLKVPYEILNKKYRVSQKVIDREVNHLNQSLEEIKTSTSLSKVHKALDSVVQNLKNVKRKAEESMLDEQEAAQACKRRLEHLRGMFDAPYNPLVVDVWKKKRLDRMLVDHLLRSGYHNSAAMLTEHSELKSLTNLEIFQVSQKIEESLAAKDTSKCLAWCHENRSKLRKNKSPLEFKLRQQEFIEFIKQGRKNQAVQHSRKHLSNIDDMHKKEFEQMMGLIARPLKTGKEPYRSMLDESRWKELIELFKEENCKLYQLNTVSVFSVVIQAGLSALKTPNCYLKSGQRNPECPLCSPLLNKLAEDLPYPHCSQSKLICSISGEPMNENNPPMMLPNGYIYGEMSLRELSKRDDGRITCPKTNQEFEFREVVKVYVM